MKTSMVRTYLHIASQTDSKATYLAKAANKPKAQVLREALEVGLHEISKDQQASGTAALMAFAQKAKAMNFTGGPTDLAANHDKYTWDD